MVGRMRGNAITVVSVLSPRGSPGAMSLTRSACSRLMVRVRVRTRSSRCSVNARAAAMASPGRHGVQRGGD